LTKKQVLKVKILQLQQKENTEPLKSGNKTADSKKSGKRTSEKPMSMPGKGFGSLSTFR